MVRTLLQQLPARASVTPDLVAHLCRSVQLRMEADFPVMHAQLAAAGWALQCTTLGEGRWTVDVC